MPLSVRNDPERAAAFGVPHEGVPTWLRDPLLGWVTKEIGDPMSSELVQYGWRELLSLELRRVIPDQVSDINDSDVLDVIDCVISLRLEFPNAEWTGRLRRLESILKRGGSAWRVTERRLERRVDETLQRVASDILATKKRPAQYLEDAWRKAWGRNPDASGSYRDAVRSVEAAYRPIVSPKNQNATLGTIIRDIENKPQKFKARLQPKNDRSNVGRIMGMMHMLWTSELDRHGTDDPDTPLSVSLEEAQDAVVLAVTLVHFAQQGGFESSNRG